MIGIQFLFNFDFNYYFKKFFYNLLFIEKEFEIDKIIKKYFIIYSKSFYIRFNSQKILIQKMNTEGNYFYIVFFIKFFNPILVLII